MIAILEKYEHNVDFHQIVDFVEASHISPSFSGRTVPLFDSMLVHQGEGSGTLTEPHHTPSPEAQQSSPTAPSSPSLPPTTTETIPTTEMATKIAAQDLEISSLKARIKMLEDKAAEGAEPSEEDATIKGRSLETGEEAASILTSGVQVASVLPTAEVATVSVPTGSGMVPTDSPIFTTASVVTPYARRKGKEKMVELDTPKKKKLQEHIDVQVAREIEEQMAREDQRRSEQITRDAEIARIHAEEELQMLIDGLDRNNETIAKSLCKSTQVPSSTKKASLQEATKRIYMSIEDFVPMAFKEKGERFKIKGLRLEHDNAKKMKISEEVSEEDLKAMMQLVPVKEVYVEALQVKHPIIDWDIHTEGQRNYWKIIIDQEIFMLVEKDYPLRKGLAIVMISNKIQVENYSQMASDLIQKIHKIANSPRQRDD
nr:hypothetical protein [Tanacetum cinerariifolium]